MRGQFDKQLQRRRTWGESVKDLPIPHQHALVKGENLQSGLKSENCLLVVEAPDIGVEHAGSDGAEILAEEEVEVAGFLGLGPSFARNQSRVGWGELATGCVGMIWEAEEGGIGLAAGPMPFSAVQRIGGLEVSGAEEPVRAISEQYSMG